MCAGCWDVIAMYILGYSLVSTLQEMSSWMSVFRTVMYRESNALFLSGHAKKCSKFISFPLEWLQILTYGKKTLKNINNLTDLLIFYKFYFFCVCVWRKHYILAVLTSELFCLLSMTEFTTTSSMQRDLSLDSKQLSIISVQCQQPHRKSTSWEHDVVNFFFFP